MIKETRKRSVLCLVCIWFLSRFALPSFSLERSTKKGGALQVLGKRTHTQRHIHVQSCRQIFTFPQPTTHPHSLFSLSLPFCTYFHPPHPPPSSPCPCAPHFLPISPMCHTGTHRIYTFLDIHDQHTMMCACGYMWECIIFSWKKRERVMLRGTACNRCIATHPQLTQILFLLRPFPL